MFLESITYTIFLMTNVLLCRQSSEDEQQRVIVHTSRGDVRGFHTDNLKSNDIYKGEGDVFLGIPYAEASVGENRFQKSKLIKKYKGVIEANRYGEICPQFGGELHSKIYDTGMGENCLTLNIFAPNISDHSTKHAVLVFIHGGALKFGDAAEFRYRGIISNIVRRGTVWISITYRLGMLGFFTTNSPEFPANRGLWDQITALQWIHEEITNFGGDPNRITLIGHSAGACSASLLAMSPAVDPSLFHGIILQSCSAEICFDGIYGKYTQSFDRAEQICGVIARSEGWTKKNIEAMKECLSKINDTEMNAYDSQTFRWNVVVDNELFPTNPNGLKWRNIPVLMGSVTDEYATYVELDLSLGKKKLEDYTTDNVKKEIRYQITKHFNEEFTDEIYAMVSSIYEYPNDTNNPVENIKYMTRVLSDLMYIRAVGEEAERRINEGDHVWLWQIALNTDYYSFYKFDNYKPAFHGMELFLLMQPDQAWLDSNQWDQMELNAADAIAEQFTHFAKNSAPTKEWERLDMSRMNYWKIEDSISKEHITIEENYGGNAYNFWKAISKLVKKCDRKPSEKKLLPHENISHVEL